MLDKERIKIELEKLRKELRDLESDKEATERMLDDPRTHYSELNDLRADLSYDNREIENVKKKIKSLELGKIIK